jgi:hypothetical protein
MATTFADGIVMFETGDILRANQTDNNGGRGIVAITSTGNLFHQANKAHHNASGATDTWKSNQFGTANDPSIK